VPRNLIEEAWSIFDSPELNDLVVKPSMPILYFGDLKGYFSESNRFRTITVGINPSLAEFPRHNPFQRFGGFDMLRLHENRGDKTFQDCYVEVLSKYFRCCPYEWFDSFEDFFEGMECSFYDDAPSLALHTDLRSPLATNSAWADLSRGDRRRLRQMGEPLWIKLVAYLKPRAIIFAVDPEPLYDASGWKVIHSVVKKKDGTRRERPYELRHHHDSKTGADLFHAPMVNVPFGSITNEEKHMLGKKVRHSLKSPSLKLSQGDQ
jgi:hypothetical protein